MKHGRNCRLAEASLHREQHNEATCLLPRTKTLPCRRHCQDLDTSGILSYQNNPSNCIVFTIAQLNVSKASSHHLETHIDLPVSARPTPRNLPNTMPSSHDARALKPSVRPLSRIPQLRHITPQSAVTSLGRPRHVSGM